MRAAAACNTLEAPPTNDITDPHESNLSSTPRPRTEALVVVVCVGGLRTFMGVARGATGLASRRWPDVYPACPDDVQEKEWALGVVKTRVNATPGPTRCQVHRLVPKS